MHASNSMTRDVIVIPPELLLADAWSIMQREHIRHLPVVSGGALVGIVSDRDVLLRASLGADGKVSVQPQDVVATAMTPAPFVCGMTTPIEEIVKVMTEKKIDAIPVVSANDQLVGLVTSTDLLLLLINSAQPLPFAFQIHETLVPKQ